MTENKRFIVIDVPYENGEPFLYKKMLDKTTKKEYDNTLKGIDDMCDLANKLHKENEQLKSRVDDLEYQLNYVTKCKEMCFKDIEILDKKYEKLREENKERKRAYDVCKFRRMNDANVIYCLEKENEELKEINQDNQDYISSLEEEKNNLQIK